MDIKDLNLTDEDISDELKKAVNFIAGLVRGVRTAERYKIIRMIENIELGELKEREVNNIFEYHGFIIDKIKKVK